MTTIAYRDGVLASDSLVQSGNARVGSTTKIIRTHLGMLAGATGCLGDCRRFLDWVEQGMRGEPPKPSEDMDGLIVKPSGKLLFSDITRAVYGLDVEYAAIGSGANFALGAMEMGATAERAVEVAVKFDSRSGGQIVTMRIEK